MTPGGRAEWDRFLGTEGCTCPAEYKSLGILHGVSMGKGWVRTGTDPACPHHGPDPGGILDRLFAVIPPGGPR